MLILFHYIGILILKILQKRKCQKKEDVDNLTLACDLENTIRFDPPVYRQRYATIYQILIDERWRTKISKLCDFGCAEFGLFVFIKKLNRLNEILFVDIDEELLKEYLMRIFPLTIEYLKRREEPLKVNVFAGSVGDPDYHILNTDVITAIELIEHLFPDTLEAFPYNVFNYVEPKIVIVTSPNADFNVVFSSDPKKLRHYDHKFEWTREQFEDWANNIVIRFPDYTVSFSGVGEGPEGTENLGFCSQIATFVRKDVIDEEHMLKKYLIQCWCPVDSICKGIQPSMMSCKCTCPFCSPSASYGICTYLSYSKHVLDKEMCNDQQNPLINIYYKTVKKVEYPFERDDRTEEEKLMDEFRYRINNFGQTYTRFFVLERERAEIPLTELLYGPDGATITEPELATLLEKHDYQIEKCVIQETNQLETCVIFEPLMDNRTSSSDASDFENNSEYFQSVNESLSDWDEPQPEQVAKAGTSKKEDEPKLSSLELMEHLKEERSAKILDKFLNDSELYINNIIKANNVREVERKLCEEVKQKKLLSDLETDTAEAERMFNEIAGKWAEMQRLNDPLQIHEDILNQKSKCEELIGQKDATIQRLKQEVQIAEGRFNKDQEKQHEDVNILSERIEKQIKLMNNAYKTQYKLIDQVINDEKQRYIDFHNKLWEELFERRNKEEINYFDYKFRKQKEITAKVEEANLNFEDDYRRTKEMLENDVQLGQQELETLKVILMVNRDKMNYNYQLLRSREEENLLIKADQKRRITNLQDTIHRLRMSLNEYKRFCNQGVKKYHSSMKQLHQNIVELNKKVEKYAKNNDATFHRIWEMNKTDCLDIVNKIFATDMLLHQQQLGATWTRPIFRPPEITNMPSYSKGLHLLDKPESVFVSTVSTSCMKTKVSEAGEKAEQRDQIDLDRYTKIDSPQQYRRLLKYLLMLISDKTGFLTENRLKELIINFEDENRSLVTLDNVFLSLGIQKPEDIDIIINYFLRYCYCPVCADSLSIYDISRNGSISEESFYRSSVEQHSSFETESDSLLSAVGAIQQPGDIIEDVILQVVSSESPFHYRDIGMGRLESAVRPGRDTYSDLKEQKIRKARFFEERVQCRDKHPLVISSVYVMSALRDFVASFYDQTGTKPKTYEALNIKRHTISRLLCEKDIQTTWNSFKSTFTDHHARVWDGIQEGLTRYYELLKYRKAVSEEVVDLRKQNSELKMLLQQYVNEGSDMINAPCAMQR